MTASQGSVGATNAVTVSDATQCLTDRFSVTNGGGGINPPTICGTNTGEHMYVDMNGNNCNSLGFVFGANAVGASIPTR